MKKITYSLLLSAMILGTACSDYLEQTPTNR